MAAIKKIGVFFLIFSFLGGTTAFADEAELRKTIQRLEERIETLEKKIASQERNITAERAVNDAQEQKISEYNSKFTQLDEKLHRETGKPIPLVGGLEISAGATMIVQGTNNIDNAASDVQKKKNRTDASYSADITIGKDFKEIDGRAFLHLEGGQGEGLEDDLTLYSNVNYDADNHENVRLTELWYEQGFLQDKAALTFGKLDPTVYFDNNEFANDETIQFLGRVFRNNPAIDFPDNGAGIRFAFMPTEGIEFNYGLFDGNSDWEKMFDNLVNMGQVNFKTSFFGRPGNYRFFGWNNNTYYTKWLDTGKNKESAYGFGLSFDQRLTENTGVFCRYGWQDPKIYSPDIEATAGLNYSLEQSWSAGLQFEGKPWGREKDVLAFAIGQVFPSGDYKKAGEALDPARRAKTEGHIESYYRVHINDHLSLSPDFQYIWNPFGKDVADDTASIFVGGMRAQVDF